MKISASFLSVFVGVGVGVASAGDSGLRSSTDQRLLQDDCDSIADAVCNLGDQYSTMCDIVKNETAMSSMDFGTKEYTVFIPDDTAWTLFQPSMAGLSEEEVGRIVSFHFYEGIELTYNELECGETLTAVTGDTSRTKCDQGHGADIKHQNGNGNTIQESLPTITNVDIDFCQGVAHTIDHLMLPVHLEEFVPVGSSEDHHKDNPGKMKSGFDQAAACNNGSTGYFWCTATNECLPPSDNTKCDEAEKCNAQSGSTGYSWCAATNTCERSCDDKPPGSSYCTYSPDEECYANGWPECCAAGDDSCPDARPGCDTGRYCVFSPDQTCYVGGWPECCLDESKGCPDERPPCDVQGQSYCVWAPNFDCYAGGWPACCLEDYTGCPSEQPGCEMTQAPIVGASYCTYAPDAGCYTRGWPECCLNDDGNCPEEQPGCDFQCNRDCSGNIDCQTTGGVWDPGMPWCGGTCANGHCQPVITKCTEDSDCGDKAICGTYGFCVGKQPYENQCGRNCSGNYDCAQDGGIWDTGSPWCGICEDGYCRPTIQECTSDADCDDDVSVCGPTIPGGFRFCVGK